MEKHKVDDCVEWTSQSAGYTTIKRGKIVAVVPEKGNALQFVPEGFGCRNRYGFGMPRSHESYLIKVKGKGRKLYWPHVSGLKKIDSI